MMSHIDAKCIRKNNGQIGIAPSGKIIQQIINFYGEGYTAQQPEKATPENSGGVPLWLEPKLIANGLSSFMVRPKELKQIVNEQLLGNQEKQSNNVIALWGPGGCGKTALALAACCSSKVHQRYEGGIFWINLGNGKDVAEGIEDLYEVSLGTKPLSNTVDRIANELLKRWNNKPRLIVLDNIQTDKELRQFLSCGKQCTWLLTTRNKKSFEGFGKSMQINPLTFEESILLLRYSLFEIYGIDTSSSNELSQKLKELADKLYEFPLLINSVKKRFIFESDFKHESSYAAIFSAIRNMLDEIEKHGWYLFKDEISESFNDGIKCLLENEKEFLKELIIFPEEFSIPLSVLKKLWCLNESKALALCEKFYNWSFLKKYDPERKTICMNIVLRQYFLQDENVNKKRSIIHMKLLESYKKFYQVHLIPDESLAVIFNNLAYEDADERNYMRGFYQYHIKGAGLDEKSTFSLVG